MERQLATDAAVRFTAEIPAAYTRSPYPLHYYFELQTAEGSVTLWPGLGPDLANQPYIIVRTETESEEAQNDPD